MECIVDIGSDDDGNGAHKVAENPHSILVNSVKNRLRRNYITPSRSLIHRVPMRLRKTNEEAYTPHMVSIGPLHWGASNLQAMEEYKSQYVYSLLKRAGDFEGTVDACGRAILSVEEAVRRCYKEPIGPEKSLAEMLLVDGCFILELFFRNKFKMKLDTLSDPIIHNHFKISVLQRDLLLLENQIPFFVLEVLFNLTLGCIDEKPSYSLSAYALHFFLAVLNIKEDRVEAMSRLSSCHLLDLVHQCYLPSCYANLSPKKTWNYIHCVTELKHAGLGIRRAESDNFCDVKLANNHLEIPAICILHKTESLLRNFIAFEQSCHMSTNHITSYAILMDHLIASPKDAEFLQRKSIIRNCVGHSEDVCRMFNSICKEIVWKDFIFVEICEGLDRYYRSWWHRNQAILRRDHCQNPWKCIAIIAATAILVLTFLQTIYSVMGYYPH